MTPPKPRAESLPLWVVEMRTGPARWVPTIGACITARDAKGEIRGWRLRNPHDEFRIRRYRREVSR